MTTEESENAEKNGNSVEEELQCNALRFVEQNFGKNISEKYVEENDRRVMHSMNGVKRRELERERISTIWMKIENVECFDDATISTVDVPVKEHKRPEVIEAKEKEIENLEKYRVFEEVEDEGQEKVG